ncbi:uncharacterized protein LOC134302234 [Trichomycterus rosablanca]|uniref:uncharacterized protein LOC134302234 n=1 Tax=Trichomycterus rosablanca TaxID=2290929 RepID=UPI002F35B9B2
MRFCFISLFSTSRNGHERAKSFFISTMNKLKCFKSFFSRSDRRGEQEESGPVDNLQDLIAGIQTILVDELIDNLLPPLKEFVYNRCPAKSVHLNQTRNQNDPGPSGHSHMLEQQLETEPEECTEGNIETLRKAHEREPGAEEDSMDLRNSVRQVLFSSASSTQQDKVIQPSIETMTESLARVLCQHLQDKITLLLQNVKQLVEHRSSPYDCLPTPCGCNYSLLDFFLNLLKAKSSPNPKELSLYYKILLHTVVDKTVTQLLTKGCEVEESPMGSPQCELVSLLHPVLLTTIMENLIPSNQVEDASCNTIPSSEQNEDTTEVLGSGQCEDSVNGQTTTVDTNPRRTWMKKVWDFFRGVWQRVRRPFSRRSSSSNALNVDNLLDLVERVQSILVEDLKDNLFPLLVEFVKIQFPCTSTSSNQTRDHNGPSGTSATKDQQLETKLRGENLTPSNTDTVVDSMALRIRVRQVLFSSASSTQQDKVSQEPSVKTMTESLAGVLCQHLQDKITPLLQNVKQLLECRISQDDCLPTPCGCKDFALDLFLNLLKATNSSSPEEPSLFYNILLHTVLDKTVTQLLAKGFEVKGSPIGSPQSELVSLLHPIILITIMDNLVPSKQVEDASLNTTTEISADPVDEFPIQCTKPRRKRTKQVQDDFRGVSQAIRRPLSRRFHSS